MRDDVTGDPEQVLTFVKRCAEAFALTGRWGFEWANTCSRPRINAFGGGAHVVDLADGSTIAWTDTNGWLALTLANGQRSEKRRVGKECGETCRSRGAADVYKKKKSMTQTK